MIKHHKQPFTGQRGTIMLYLHSILISLLTLGSSIGQSCWKEHPGFYWIPERIIRLFYQSSKFLSKTVLKSEISLGSE